MSGSESGTCLGPCAKKKVRAIAKTYDGRYFAGENLCTNPQITCPRTEGEAYYKCYAVCGQIGHAEDVLLRQLRLNGLKADDVEWVRVYNHHGPCDSCRALLDATGLREKTTFFPTTASGALGDIDSKHAQRIKEAYHLVEPSSHSRHYVQKDYGDF